MSAKIVEMIKNARKPIELNAKPGDNVLIVADTDTDPLVWQALAAAAHEFGATPTITLMTPRPAGQYDPPLPVINAMKKAELNLLVPTKSLIHSPGAMEAGRVGSKCVAMEQITPDMLSKGASTADYNKMQQVGEKIRQIWTEGKTVHVVSELGTDLTADIKGVHGFYVAGKVNRQPGITMYACAFPDGEAGISPVEGTGEGTVVFDTTIHHVGLIREPIKVIVKNGLAVNIQGGREARMLRDFIDTFGDDYTYNFPAEISIGINPKARITGVMREDKKLLGAVHIAFGTNIDTGGTITSKLHIDGTIRYPTVYVDGKVIVDKGKLNL
jgi:leucyl aminopeptidase (aminopeptidase T)